METHITFVLDSSGSMEQIVADTRGGFNSLLEDQRDEPGEATVTLYEFNTTVERHYRARPIEDAPRLTEENYEPSGRTALHDAMTRAIKETGEWIGSLTTEDAPDHVLVVILTDGKENASETPLQTVTELIELRQREDDWEFLFIGANQDAVLTAKELGMERDRALTMSHSGEGTRAAYESTSAQIDQLRRQGSTDGYDETDRRRQEDAE